MSFEIGILGSVILLLAWLFEMIKSIQEHKSLVDLRFALIYLVGIFFLIIYSISITDIVYIALNSMIAVFVISEILLTIITLRKRKGTEKRKLKRKKGK